MAWWLFQNVAITTALAAMVVAVCRTTRIGPVARHALWVLVLVKFVTPPLVVWPWPAPDPLGLARLELSTNMGSSADAPTPDAAGTGVTARDPDVLTANALSEMAAPGGPLDRERAEARAASLFWIIGVWISGSVCLIMLEVARLTRLARRVRTATPAESAIVRRVANLSARLGLRPVPVLTVEGCATPFVWCVGAPRLLWPAALSTASSDACIDGVLVHELAHVKRRDHFVGWIELAAAMLWWWNPLFWFVRSALREQAELACDAWVISALPDGRRAYAESLLALSGAALHGAPSLSMAAVVGIRSGSRRVLERRLVMIMKGRASHRLPLAGVLALALIAGATLPAWATGPEQQPPPPPRPPASKPVTPASPDTSPLPPPAPKPAPAKPQTGQLPPPPPPPPSPPAARPQVVAPSPRLTFVKSLPLPEDGRQLVEGFETDRRALQEEVERKIDERREAVVKALQTLQEQYTKAGKLDEALAIRDYLRAGGPGRKFNVFYGRFNWKR